MVSSSRSTSRLSYSEVARFGKSPESHHSAPASIYQTSPQPLASCFEPTAPPLSAASSASSTYLRTPSEITLFSYKDVTTEARSRERRALLWKAVRSQPQTPLLGTTNDSTISLPTDYEFRAELVDDGVGGAIARVPRSSTSILSRSPSLLSTSPSSPLSLPDKFCRTAVFASRPMLRRASLPITSQLSYESFEAGLIAKERLNGSVELTGEAQPSKMSPAAKGVIPVKGFNSSTSLAPARDRYRSRSDSYILRRHHWGDADDDELPDEDPSFEVEDLSLSFTVEEDDFSCPSPSLGSNGLAEIQLLGGFFGVVVDESEGEPPAPPDQSAVRDSEKENRAPGRPIGAVKTPTRPERPGKTHSTSTDSLHKPIPIVDDRSPLSDRSAQFLYSSATDPGMPVGTAVGRLFCPDAPSSYTSRNKIASVSPTLQLPLTYSPLRTSNPTFISSSSGEASTLQDDSEEILYIPRRWQAVSTRTESSGSLNLHLETTSDNAVVGEEVRSRRSGGSIGVIGEEVRNALARSTGSTSSSRSSLGDLTIKPTSHGGREFGDMDPRSQRVPEQTGSCFAYPPGDATSNLLAAHTPPSKPSDFGSFDHGTINPGRPVHVHSSGADDSDRPVVPPGLPTPPRKGFIPPISELVPAPLLLRRVSARRVSQEPASSLPDIAEVSISLSSPPVSPSVEASPNQQPKQPLDALPSGPRSATWSFVQEDSKAVKIPSLQLGPPLPVQTNIGSPGLGADSSKQSTPDEQRDLRLSYIRDHWEEIPNWISTQDWAKTASKGTIDLKSVYDLVDLREMEAILDFAHHSRIIMDLVDSTQPALTLGSVFCAPHGVTILEDFAPAAKALHDPTLRSIPIPFRPATTQPLGTSSRSFGWNSARGWPHRAPSASQEGRHNPTANNKVSTSVNQPHHPASTSTRSYSQLHPATLPKLHAPSVPFHDPTTAYQRDTLSHLPTASTLLQSFQPQPQAHPSALLPIPLLGESPQADYYPYSSYIYNTPHPYCSNFNQTPLEHHQNSISPRGPRFLALRHSGIHRYY